jgi:hypothetical protein
MLNGLVNLLGLEESWKYVTFTDMGEMNFIFF